MAATTTASKEDQAAILTSVLALASLFSTCVETFGLIHPSHDSDASQKLMLVKLGIEQGRLLIFGDVVGISSPPATIATHMVPSRAGLTNPDPTQPIYFGVRDPRLDQTEIRCKIEAALNEIVDRPAHLGREEMMELYGMKPPKRFSSMPQPALDTNRLDAFREKYSLLQDLSQHTSRSARRGMSMAAQHWTVKDVTKFSRFVKSVREQVDSLVQIMDVKEKIDRAMRLDIKALGWHPDIRSSIMQQDWEKLKLINIACKEDYPEYAQATEVALKYIDAELRESSGKALRAAFRPTIVNPVEKKKHSEGGMQEKRSGILSNFSFKNWGGKKGRTGKERNESISSTLSTSEEVPRSLSEAKVPDMQSLSLEPVRSKSVSAIPDKTPALNLDTKLVTIDSNESNADTIPGSATGAVMDNQLFHADTVHSLIDRHDMYQGVGRLETKDIRAKAHELA
ncbi:hypothetical protein K432DRAFT_387611 [Lepidopterella palustris CBS 459.81]|uniref:Prion-inhibition and propagation HeLo domain-containing protein n=1 Tax=Lepidopterella palustris CBS 459.81 TaxID=1314670 RepID=A0A8E2DWT8_9PEZI|nr:hypothetical protein K432DRAFT_387611 [Lepidopterella palustris CBS 459.81]